MTLFFVCIHLAGAIGLLYASWNKNRILLAKEINFVEASRLLWLDRVSGVSAAVVVLAGLALLLKFAKPTQYYLSQSAFILKLAILAITSALIVVTKVQFRKWVRAREPNAVEVPPHIRWILRADFAGLIVMVMLGFSLSR